jgi:ABC-type antimicrobial peptide transport system permease subunit
MATQESINLALDTLRKNKLRSGLTILGISIGIATVILISSAINGLNTNVDNFIQSLGTNTLWVFHYDPFGRRPTTEELNRKRLTLEEALAIRQLPYVVAVDAQLLAPRVSFAAYVRTLSDGNCLEYSNARSNNVNRSNDWGEAASLIVSARRSLFHFGSSESGIGMISVFASLMSSSKSCPISFSVAMHCSVLLLD